MRLSPMDSSAERGTLTLINVVFALEVKQTQYASQDLNYDQTLLAHLVPSGAAVGPVCMCYGTKPRHSFVTLLRCV
jgi:hypothetical protein